MQKPLTGQRANVVTEVDSATNGVSVSQPSSELRVHRGEGSRKTARPKKKFL